MLNKIKSLIIFLIVIHTILYSKAAQEPLQPQYVRKLSDGIPTCPEDNTVDSCIRDAFNYMIRSSIKGVPELNIPPIDPMRMNKLNVQFSNNLIRGKAAVRNVSVVGISTAEFKRVHYERKDNDVKLSIHIQLPLLQITGKYRAEVVINNARFSSKGLFNISLIDIDSKSDHYAQLYERDGHTFMSLTGLNLDPTLGDMKIYASGLVPDPALNNALLEIVNSQWRIIYRSVVTSTRSTWQPIVVNYTNNFFSHLPFDLLITNRKN
ncbi:uncharacterized protein isoform X2 [Musca autumnalis]|uniref:uncharacterized protein isoform X2 n=1 Tax=Musca autumnalis TaxID=221902 RepID=UPI003CF5CB33